MRCAPAPLAFVAIALVGPACAYDWTVGQGGASSASVASNAASTSSTSSASTSTGSTCAALLADYDAALLASKRCTMGDPTECQASATDGCGCKVFLDRAGSAEADAFVTKKNAALAAGCSFGCATCPVGPVIGSCLVDPKHGATSCSP